MACSRELTDNFGNYQIVVWSLCNKHNFYCLLFMDYKTKTFEYLQVTKALQSKLLFDMLICCLFLFFLFPWHLSRLQSLVCLVVIRQNARNFVKFSKFLYNQSLKLNINSAFTFPLTRIADLLNILNKVPRLKSNNFRTN